MICIMIHFTSNQLRQAADLKDKIAALETELTAILGAGSGTPLTPHAPQPAKRSGMSAAGRRRIAAAQKARWARVRTAQTGAQAEKATPATQPVKLKRQMSAAQKAKISAAAKRRWAKAKAAGRNTL